MKLIGAIFAVAAFGQTLPNPNQIPWQQVDWTFCGSPAHPGTKIRLWQIKAPPGALDNCWPQSLNVAAWSVINTRCTRCHGNGVIEENAKIGIIQEPPTAYPPGRVDTVGNLDMRTKEAILTGGSRGPALKPRDPMGSLIYLFSSRYQFPGGQMPNPPNPFQHLDTQLGSGFRFIPLDSTEESVGMPPFFPLLELELKALYDWIVAGAPTPI